MRGGFEEGHERAERVTSAFRGGSSPDKISQRPPLVDPMGSLGGPSGKQLFLTLLSFLDGEADRGSHGLILPAYRSPRDLKRHLRPIRVAYPGWPRCQVYPWPLP